MSGVIDKLIEGKLLSAVWEGDKAGIESMPIYMKFEEVPFDKGEFITNDFRDGSVLRVLGFSNDLVFAELVTTDPDNSYVPGRILQAGTKWYQISHKVGEYDTMYSKR